jgi:hypothetical protein
MNQASRRRRVAPPAIRGSADRPSADLSFHPTPLCMGACKEAQHQVILALDFEVVLSNGREGRSRGFMGHTWSSLYSSFTLYIPPLSFIYPNT